MKFRPKSSWILPIACLVSLPVLGQVQVAWTARYDGPDHQRESEPLIHTDRASNVVVALTSARADSGEDFVLLKYDSAGQPLWTNRFSGPAAMHSFVVDLALDAADNIYVVGASPAPESYYDYVTVKFAPDGTQRWLARFSSSGASYDQPSALAVDGAGHVYVTGVSLGGVTTVKYDADGQQLWFKRDLDLMGLGRPGQCLALDGASNVYLAGVNDNELPDASIFIIRYDPSGTRAWKARLACGINCGVVALALDAATNLVLTGYADRNAGDGYTYADILTLKYDAAGSLLWSNRYDGITHGPDYPSALGVDAANNIYVAGRSHDTEDAYLLLKYDAAGHLLWRADLSDPDLEDQPRLALDADGNVYYFVQISSTGYCLAKYAPNGDRLWWVFRPGQNPDLEHPSSLALDAGGNILLAGTIGPYNDTSDVGVLKYAPTELPGWPRITTAPQDQYTTNGGTVTFSVTATPDPSGLNYQWFFNGQSLNDQTNASLVLTQVDWNDIGRYWVEVSNAVGSTISPSAMLQIVSPPTIVVPPQDQYVVLGSSAQFSVEASDEGPLCCQWRFNGSAILGATNAVLTMVNVQLADAGHYSVVVSNPVGAVESAAAFLGVMTSLTQAWDRQLSPDANLGAAFAVLTVDGAGNVYAAGYVGDVEDAFGFLTAKYDADGHLVWSVVHSSTNSFDYAQAIALDPAGNVIVAGVSAAQDEGDFLTIKYDPNGNQLWTARYNGPANDYDGPESPECLAVDAAGNIYVTGSSHSAQSADVFTIKYSPSGNVLWTARYSSPGEYPDGATAMALDATGNVYVTGIARVPNQVMITLKYNAGGQQLWVATYGTNDYPHSRSVAVDDAGNVYVAGQVNDDYVTLKFNAAGQLQWSARYDGLGHDYDFAEALAVDATGHVYVTGQSFVERWYIDADYGDIEGNVIDDYDMVTLKYDTEGRLLWSARYDGPAHARDQPLDMALDATGHIYITGWSPGLGTGIDFATIKYDPVGNRLWVARYNRTGSGDDTPFALKLNVSNDVFVAGRSEVFGRRTTATLVKYVQNETTSGPVIVAPPQSQVAVAGSNVLFTVSATGDAPLRYQWFFNRRPVADATNATLVLSNVTVAQAGCYAAEVANPAGLAATPEARLEVIVPPIITRALQNQSAAPGVNVAFYVAATGDAPLSYQWQFNGVPIPGATGTALALTNVQSSHAGVYSVVISNHAGVATTAAFLGISSRVRLDWVQTFNGPSNHVDSLTASTQDRQGNLIVTGRGARDPVHSANDAVTRKYDPAGNLLWSAAYTDSSPNQYAEPSAITVDDAGNVYVAARVYRPLLSYLTLKYSAAGALLWEAVYPGPSYNSPTAIAVDSAGNVIVTGVSQDAQHQNDYATVKYDATGRPLWVARYAGAAGRSDIPHAVTVDAAGNIYVTGEEQTSSGCTAATIKYAPDGRLLWVARETSAGSGKKIAVDPAGNVLIIAHEGVLNDGSKYATIKYAATDGRRLWFASYTGLQNGRNLANDLKLDSVGNVYVTGASEGDMATLKYNPSGQLLWAARLHEENSWKWGQALALDAAGNVYVVGTSDPPGAPNCTRHILAVKYDPNGNQLWTATLVGLHPVECYPSQAMGIYTDGAGSVFVTGSIQENVLDYVLAKYVEQSLPGAPMIEAQPASQTVLAGATATLQVVPDGAEPLRCQWCFHRVPILGATNFTLVIPSVTPAAAGNYSAIVYNDVDFVVSAEATLTVIVPLSLEEALDTTGLVWTTGYESYNEEEEWSPWFGQTATTHDGVDAAVGSGYGCGPWSYLETTVNGPGMVSFWWKTFTTEEWYEDNDVRFYVLKTNGIVETARSLPGNADWRPETVTFGPGPRILRWEAHGYCDGHDEQTTAWVDQVIVAAPGREEAPQFVVTPVSQTLPAGTNVSFRAVAVAYPLPALQWFHNGAPLPGATNTTLSLVNIQAGQAGTYSVIASNALGVIVSSAQLTVEESAPRIVIQPVSQTLPLGASTTLRVVAQGTEPIAYQWQFNGTNPPDATNAWLVLASVTPEKTGVYRVRLSNALGEVISEDALVTVVPVVHWNASGLVNDVPHSATNAMAVSAGSSHQMVLKRDGTVIGWGRRGDVLPDWTNITAIAAGGFQTIALRRDGTVSVAGFCGDGQCDVPAGLGDVVAVATGNRHCLALKRDGRVVAWGRDYHGYGPIPSGATNLVAIAAGMYHNLGLHGDGTVMVWGTNFYASQTVPVDLDEVIAIAAGSSHNLALRRDGTVRAWGANYAGQCDVPAGLSNVVAITAGGGHGLALKADGTLVKWGSSTGVPTEVPSLVAIDAGASDDLALVGQGSPHLTQPPLSRLAYAGGKTFFMVQAAGAPPLQCQWQKNGTNLPGATQFFLALSNLQAGDAGDYTVVVSNALGIVNSAAATLTVAESQPVILLQPLTQTLYRGHETTLGIIAVGSEPLQYQWRWNGVDIPGATHAVLPLGPALPEVGGSYSVVIANGLGTMTSAPAIVSVVNVAGWGWNDDGQILTPAGVTNAISIDAGWAHSVAVNADGHVFAWGKNQFGQCNVPAGLEDVVAVAAQGYWSMALRRNGTVVAWGASPAVPAGLSNVVAIAAGGYRGLALKSDGQLATWEADPIAESLSNIVAIACGVQHYLALQRDGTVIAWGGNASGQSTVPAGLADVVAISAKQNHSLALKRDGTVVAWGENGFGQCEVPPGLANVVAIAAGDDFSLALRADGAIIGWGRDCCANAGSVLRPPSDLRGVQALAGGRLHALALLGHGPPPFIATQPLASDTVVAGGAILLQAGAASVAPLTYQWQRNGLNLAGQTNAVLALNHLQESNAGRYRVVIVNAGGTVISAETVLTVLPASAAPSCAGTLDPSFAVPEEFPNLWSWYPPILAMTVQGDGKVVIADGYYDSEAGRWMYAPPIRFHADGSLDTDYVPNPADVMPHTRVVQSDGKVLELVPGTNDAPAQLVRFNADGSRDLGFVAALPGGFVPTVVALQPGGWILVAGGVLRTNQLDIYNTQYWKEKPVVRLHPDGQLDASFYTDLTFDAGPMNWNSYLADYIHDMVVGPDGRIYIGGFFTRINGLRRTDVARLNADGTLDLSFEADLEVCVGCDIDARHTVSALELTPDGKLVIAGKLSQINGLERHAVARLHTRDESCAGIISFAAERFTVSETNAQATVTALRHGDTSQRVSVRYQTYTNYYFTFPEATEGSDYQPVAGTLDFAPGETVKTIVVPLQNDPRIEPNERIWLSLSEPTGDALLRTPVQAYVLILDDEAADRPGNVDISFQPDLGGFAAWGTVRALATDTQSIWVAGLFDQVDGLQRQGVARLHLDGRPDTNFNPVFDGPVTTFAIERATSRVLVGGGFTTVNGFPHTGLVRFNADGTRDETFQASDYGAVSVVEVQSDGRILIGGEFGVARLNADGSADATFNQGNVVPDGSVWAITVQPDGKVVIGGFFWHVHGQPREDLARLNADGSLDASFNPTAADIELMVCVYALAAQSDGKILVGGFFTEWQDPDRIGLVRLNANGALDTTFNPGPCGIVHDLVLLDSGKILVGADRYAPWQSPNRALMQLLPDGALDPGFFVDWVEDSFNAFRLAVQPNGDVVVGGSFQEVNSLPYPWLARLHGDLTGTHAPNPGSLSFSAPVYRVNENGSAATVAVRRLWGTQGTVSARFTTQDDTATAGADYMTTSAVITFADGDGADKTITIPILDDLAGEGDETVQLMLSDVTGGATLGSFASVPLTIAEDDLVFEFESPVYYVSEANTHVQVWIQLRGKRGISARVEYATQDGTARAGLDYVATSNAWTFPEAGYGYLPYITILNDGLYEGDETFTVTLRNPTGGAVLGSNHTATVVIVDDEVVGPVITAPPVSQTKLVGQTASFSVTATGTPPLRYQWYFNSSAMAGATNATLILSNVNPSQAGTYYVRVANAAWAAITDTASLIVLDPAQRWTWVKQGGGRSYDLGTHLVQDSQGNLLVLGGCNIPAAFGTNQIVSPDGEFVPFLAKYNAAGNLIWLQHWGRGHTGAETLGVDAADNVYVSGFFGERLTIGDTTLTGGASYGSVYLAKFDANGNPLWATAAYTANDDPWTCYATVDPAGRVYLLGYFYGEARFGGITLTNTKVYGGCDLFVASYDPQGNVAWAIRGETSGRMYPHGIVKHPQDGIYVVGDLNGTGSLGSSPVNAAGYSDLFVAKINAAGGVLWVQQASSSNDWGRMPQPAIDSQGNVYVVGEFTGTATFGTNVFVSSLESGTQYRRCFLAKYDPAGSLVWAIQTLGDDYQEAYSLAVSPAGEAYFAGRFSSNVTFGGQHFTSAFGENRFLFKCDPAGNMLWNAASSGGSKSRLALDGMGNVYLEDSFSCTNFFGNEPVIGWGGQSFLVAKYTSAGNLRWVRTAGGIRNLDCLDWAVDAAGNVNCAGYFDSVAIFGTNQLASLGSSEDLFLARLDGDEAMRTPFVHRQLSHESGTTIHLVAQPESGVAVYAVEDQPPAGWLTTNLSHGGLFDLFTGKVRFGPFQDAEPRTLSYDAVPPLWGIYGVFGVFTFSGVASVDGVDTPIVGDQHLTIAGMMPMDRNPADHNISINEVTGYGAAWRRGEVWPIGPNPIPINYVTRAGALWRWGECYTVDRSVTNEPLWWVPCQGRTSVSPVLKNADALTVVSSAESPLPSYFVPGEPLTVIIRTTPATGVGTYAVEDSVPAGWSIADLSHGGWLDAVNQRVKWGPFLDSTPRTLSYRVTPPATANGSATFEGVASFDGASISVTGLRQLHAGSRLTLTPSAGNAGLALYLQGELGRNYVVETSTDLVAWEILTTLRVVEGGVTLTIVPKPTEPHRFYRVQPAR